MDSRHHHRLEADRRALGAALAIVVALMADAGHMVTDAGALVFAVAASRMAARPAGGRWTFGYSRLEILAAQANGIALALVAVWVVYSAVRRLIAPHEVRGGLVLIVALGGATASLLAGSILARGSRDSLNVRGAFLHVVTDVAAFGAAALAGRARLPPGRGRAHPLSPLPPARPLLW